MSAELSHQADIDFGPTVYLSELSNQELVRLAKRNLKCAIERLRDEEPELVLQALEGMASYVETLRSRARYLLKIQLGAEAVFFKPTSINHDGKVSAS